MLSAGKEYVGVVRLHNAIDDEQKLSRVMPQLRKKFAKLEIVRQLRLCEEPYSRGLPSFLP